MAVASALLTLLSALAILYFYSRGYLLYYGDAEAHLNIARKIFDSRTPGLDQIGTVWLPLPHLLMLPLVRFDWLWRTGLAGAIPSAIAFVAGGAFLFAAARRLFSTAAAGAAVALYGLNPNLLYLQAIPMTEPLFWAAVLALLYFTIRYRETQGLGALLGAALATLSATLVRYEGWFLIPFACLYILLVSRRQKLARAALFGTVASLGPLCWVAHNWYYTGDALDFYRGPYSAHAIQGNAFYPGKGNWRQAWTQLRAAARLCVGLPLLLLGAAGTAAALARRVFWPLALLLLPAAFIVWSIHSSGIPIFVPGLWPHSYYNTRYGLSLLPAAALAGAALVEIAPPVLRRAAAGAVVVTAALPWLISPGSANWITWKESEVNSVARRAWGGEAARFLAASYHRGDGIVTSFGDITGIYRMAGIPLRETLTGDNWPLWPAAMARPELFLWEEWAVAMGGDAVEAGIRRAERAGLHYALVKTIAVKDAPVIEIYRRERSPAWQQRQ